MDWPENLVQLPVCPQCGNRVVATLCQTNASSPESARAIEALLLECHRLMLHG